MPDWESKDRSTMCSEHFMNDHTYETKCGLSTTKCGAVSVVTTDSEDDLDAPAALRVCRICLAMDSKMYHIWELKLDQMYEQITGLMATSEDRLPQRVCWECAGRLNSACRFRNKALRCDSLLHDMMQSDTYIKIRDIKSINRKLNQLCSTLVHQIYEDDDFDLRIIELCSTKAEETPNITEVTPILSEELDPKSLAPINEVEIYAESNNEIFFEEYDHFDEDGDNVLSEVYVENKEKPKVKKREKVARKVRTPKKVQEEEDLETTINEVEIHAKSNNEIFFEEYDHFDEDGDNVLSEVYVEKKEKPKVKKREKVAKKVKTPKKVQQEEDLETTINEVEIHAESNNEIFFEEYDHFDEDDDNVLSEVYVEKKEKPKVKKKREKVARKVRTPKKVQEQEDLETTIDKYKKNDVKRRRNREEFDESLFTITPLTYDQQIEEVLKRKESYNYSSAPYKCTICYRGFQIKERFTAHSVRHAEQRGAYECFICKARFKSCHTLRTHLTVQHTEQYSCKMCPFTTRFRPIAKSHGNWHAGKKYQCPHCDSVFDKKTSYFSHIRIKHVSDFVCDLCGYTFVSEMGIAFHKKKKHRFDKELTLEGPYCEVCDVQFVSEEAHDRHLQLSSKHSSDHDPNRIRNDSQIHGPVTRRSGQGPVKGADYEKQAPVNCEECGVQLRDLRAYGQHFRRAHPDKNRTKTNNTNINKSPVMCEQCGKIYQNPFLLKCHMWVHTGEKGYKCDLCGKSFSHKTTVKLHKVRVHSGSRPSYECPQCGKHFAFSANRDRHMFIHSGLKPFKCDTCGKCFTTTTEHKAHVDHVHLKKPWPKRARQRNRAKQCDDVSLED